MSIASETATTTITTVRFNDHYPLNGFKLLEVSSDVLDDLQSTGRLVIKGVDKNDEAVLCTSIKTYVLKSAHTSNSMMLTHQQTGSNTYSIESLQQLHYELTEIPPRLATIKTHLLKRPIDNNQCFNNVDGMVIDNGTDVSTAVGYTMPQLESLVQASPLEIQQYLNSVLHVFHIGDRIALFSERYHERLVELILTEININGWSSHSIPINECIEKIGDTPRQALEYIFHIYATKCEDKMSSNSDQYYKLDTNMICIFRGKQILKSVGVMPMDKFLEKWTDSVPVGFTPRFDMLKGVAVATVAKNNNKPTATYLSEEDLPIMPKDRFIQLFKINTKWSLPELEPYIRPIITQDAGLESFVLKFARSAPVPGSKEKIYMSRY
ncbi:hypothetical protein SAMD00019534_014570 [Acytostelium subglobosum LB1]|uniref:hypothetical protein n=1 Tax=Acytostelium subglobosum LB1 TaxID=1410327 RepID=UPI000644AC99|nr:hypothetical protein SAMD00019534_014570 [Acytostelium subglobosum LB1]GAM18282.1 hypothetical protein SAMD00019534_014570 [Acytostelium subglobosum LB1]|eukprot:XP_012758878.1 hypothetical protein SAMD00019534_014570 [Acytostelium subglobosum LB1]